MFWPQGPPPSVDEVRRLSAARDTVTALGVAAEFVVRRPDDREILALLRVLYAQLCDPVTEEPDTRVAVKAAQHLAIALRNALREKPGTPEQYEVLGKFALVAGQDTGAATALRRAEALGIDPAHTAVPLSLALLRAGRPQDVLANGDPAVTLPVHQQALLWTLRARAQIALGQHAAARVSFRAALNGEPGNLDALSRLGLLELWHGSRPAANELLAHARSVAPQARQTMRLAAESAYAAGDYAASATAYDALVRDRTPEAYDPIPPSLGKARALIYQGDLAAAAAALDASKLGTQDSSVMYYRALLAYRAGEFRLAGELAQRLDIAFRDYPPLDLLIGGAMLADGFPETAVQRLRHYLAAVPDNAAARSLLHSAEKQLAHPAGATVPRQQLLAAFGFTSAGSP